MPRKKQTPPTKWERLVSLIQDYADAQEADSWKGGGDPASIPSIEARLVLARAELNEYIEVLQREDLT